MSAYDRPLRVEMVVPALDLAGLEMVVVSLVASLGRLGHDVGVTCIERTGLLGDKLREGGTRVTIVPTPGLRTNVFPGQLAAWFRQSRPDVVHVHSGAWLKAVRGARMAGVPAATVYTLHGIWPEPPWYIPLYSRLAARQTDRIVAVSGSLREHLIGALGIRDDKVEVIENGIDTCRFSPAQRTGWLRRRMGLDADAAIVGTVGRLHPVKNHALLIDAFEMVRRRHPATALVIVGEGELRSDLESRIRERGLEDSVLMPGATADVVDYYREFDLFVLSSVLEGTSISGLEAMACGVCVVATAVGGNPGLLGHGTHGVLVAPDDSAAMAAAIEELLVNSGRRRALAEAARADVEAHHDEMSVARRYLNVYAAAIERSSARWAAHED